MKTHPSAQPTHAFFHPEVAHSGNHYFVQEHHARTHHFDFRLERDGVLKSWALPKGVPETQGERRLAIEVEDHPLSWGTFQGTIPEGQPGAGLVKLWDTGVYHLEHWDDTRILFSLRGGALHGHFALVRYPHSGPTHWLLIRTHDAAV